jgi:predicted membrane protein
METNKDFNPAEEIRKDIHDKIKDDMNHGYHRSGRVMAGTVIVIVGALFLARQAGVEFPNWLFTWPLALIAFGVFIGAKHSFRNPGWLIPVIIGSVFLLEIIVPELSFKQYIWPVVIITAGLFMIFRPHRRGRDKWEDWGRKRWGRRHWDKWENRENYRANADSNPSEDFIDSVAVFGGSKKNVISKDFKGGDITSFFGGTDINLMQADFTGTITLDVTNVFGGTKLIVPPNWNIKSEVVCIFGEVEDKRPIMKDGIGADTTKALKIEGTCLFGGISIKSY